MRYIARLSGPMLPTSALHQVSRVFPPYIGICKDYYRIIRKEVNPFFSTPKKAPVDGFMKPTSRRSNLCESFYNKNFDYPEKTLKYKHIRRISD